MEPTALPGSPAILRGAVDDAVTTLIWTGTELIDSGGATFDSLATMRVGDLDRLVATAGGTNVDLDRVELRAPVESQEVWAAGVTYGTSRDARMEESSKADVYNRVYRADRPEIFFKANGWRVVGPGQPVGIRADSAWNVPEPELAVLVNAAGEVVAYAAGNDMSSRSIEGDNPLYLPQAKVYDRSCALGPWAVLASGTHPGSVSLSIERSGVRIFEDSVHPDTMVRKIEDLVSAVRDWQSLPAGFWLMTGTGIVPPQDFTLEPDDIVSVSIEGVGTLTNPVVTIGPPP